MADKPPHRCRLCSANDRDALIDELAIGLWESQRYGSPVDVPFDQAGDYWHRVFTAYARSTVQLLAGLPVHGEATA